MSKEPHDKSQVYNACKSVWSDGVQGKDEIFWSPRTVERTPVNWRWRVPQRGTNWFNAMCNAATQHSSLYLGWMQHLNWAICMRPSPLTEIHLCVIVTPIVHLFFLAQHSSIWSTDLKIISHYFQVFSSWNPIYMMALMVKLLLQQL